MCALSRANRCDGSSATGLCPAGPGVAGLSQTVKTLAILCLLSLLAGTGTAAITTSWRAISSLSVQTGGSNRQDAASAALLEVRSSAREGTSEAYLRFDVSEG